MKRDGGGDSRGELGVSGHRTKLSIEPTVSDRYFRWEKKRCQTSRNGDLGRRVKPKKCISFMIDQNMKARGFCKAARKGGYFGSVQYFSSTLIDQTKGGKC